ncbi:hypothetical protein DSO57_1005576 [Entomophthora muscae]|uniref:Uncharacterized protein n=1 Tax=Entomophthora muscae TaxID=34485 RepID=A0ACC2UHB4_9FUNG|nr:hypothetical protein DSO57_1005576 [Entomophthora muscae]
MKLPVTPKPMPASSPNLPTDHTGVIDTIILAASPWSWVGRSFSYLFKLAPLLWWALPAKNPSQINPESNRLAAQDWIPDKDGMVLTEGSFPVVALMGWLGRAFGKSEGHLEKRKETQKQELAPDSVLWGKEQGETLVD